MIYVGETILWGPKNGFPHTPFQESKKRPVMDNNDKRDLDMLYEKLDQAEKERSEGLMLDGPTVMAELLL